MDMIQAILNKLERVKGPDAQGWYTTLCPYHNDQNHPNLRINPEGGFSCLACGEKGSLSKLANKLGLKECDKEVTMEKKIETVAGAMRLLKERGLTKDIIAQFQIEPDLARKAWRYPVIYQGKVVATRYKRFPNSEGKKYWWEQRGVTFQVYGLDEVEGEGEIWLVEGEPDCWVMHYAGLPAITLLSGAGTIPDGTIELLKEAGVKELNIVYDLDDAGRNGSQRVAQVLQGNGFEITIRELPDYLGKGGDITDLYHWVGRDRDKFRYEVQELSKKKAVDPIEAKGKQGKANVDYIARFDGLIDIVDHDGDLVYLVKNEEKLKVVPSVVIEGREYLPPPRDQLPYLIPRWKSVEEAYKDDTQETLFQELIEHHKSHSELPGDGYYILLAAWDFSTYIHEVLDYSGYIYLYAVPERGKTKTGQAMIYIAFRGIHQENLREADLFRASDDIGATLFLDIQNLSKKAQREGSEDILLQRFEKGARVRRVLYPEKGRFKDSRWYSIYGATVIASNEPISNILESRAFPIIMPFSAKNFPKPTPEMGLPFRERLVAWRAHNLGMKLPEPKELASGRLNDIAKPMWQIINLVSSPNIEVFEKFIGDLSDKRREERGASIEGEVIKTLMELESKAEDGKLAVSDITGKVNEGRSDPYKKSTTYIGKVLTRLNFEPARHHGGGRSYIYDAALLDRLASEYGVTDDMHSDYPSQASQVSPQIQKNPIKGDRGDGGDTVLMGAYRANKKEMPRDVMEI